MNSWYIYEIMAKEQYHDLQRRIRLDALAHQVRSGRRLNPISRWICGYIIPRLRHSQAVVAEAQTV